MNKSKPKHQVFYRIIKNLKFMLPLFLKKSPLTIVIVVLKAILNAVNRMCYVIFPSLIISELIGGRRIEYLILYVGILVVGNEFLLNFILNILEKINDYLSRKTDFEIDKMYTHKLMEVDYFLIEDPEFVDRMSRAKKGMFEYSDGVYTFLWMLESLIRDILTIAGVIGVVVFSGQYLVLALSILGITFNAIITAKIERIYADFRTFYTRYDRKLWYYNFSIAYFNNQKSLRLFNGDKLIKDTTNVVNKESLGLFKNLCKKIAVFDFLDTFLYFVFTQALAMLYLGYQCINKVLDIAGFQMLFSSIKTLDSAVSNITFQLNRYIKACEYQEDFIDLMNLKSVFKSGTEKLESIESIEFKNVSFKYPRTEKYVLKNVSFKLENKEKVSLVGLNGAGKTTIIKLLCRFYQLDEGEILINGKELCEYDYKSYMDKISVVFQDFMIISFTVRANIAICDRNQEKLYDVLERSQVLDKILSLPEKENTYINKWFDKSGVTFSGGEMQKFAIARCLYKDSDFVVLDEPTSALDPESEAKIYYNFNEIVGNKLTLFISHRLSSCIFSDRILVLDGEKIVEVGSHKELMKNKDGLYYKMFSAQASLYQ